MSVIVHTPEPCLLGEDILNPSVEKKFTFLVEFTLFQCFVLIFYYIFLWYLCKSEGITELNSLTRETNYKALFRLIVSSLF